MDPVPAARTAAARCVQPAAGGRQADVQDRPSPAIRSGACAASHMPTMPPSDTPQYSARPTPRASSSASTSRPRSSEGVGAGRGGRLARRHAVAAMLVAQQPEVPGQHRHRQAPAVPAGAQGVAEHQHRRAVGPVQPRGGQHHRVRRAGSDIEEHGLLRVLQPDVEPEPARLAAGLRGRDQRAPPLRVDRGQHRVGRVGGLPRRRSRSGSPPGPAARGRTPTRPGAAPRCRRSGRGTGPAGA